VQQQHQHHRHVTEGFYADNELDASGGSEEVFSGNDSPEGMSQYL